MTQKREAVRDPFDYPQGRLFLPLALLAFVRMTKGLALLALVTTTSGLALLAFVMVTTSSTGGPARGLSY